MLTPSKSFQAGPAGRVEPAPQVGPALPVDLTGQASRAVRARGVLALWAGLAILSGPSLPGTFSPLPAARAAQGAPPGALARDPCNDASQTHDASEAHDDARDTFSDTWVATDALGRVVPRHDAVGAPRRDRFVGIFYFLWLGPHARGGPFDITRILEDDPGALQKPTSPPWGALGAPHHWGESVFGYYRSEDPYVLRRHARMLADAGIDAVFFDVTNQLTYPESYRALLEAFAEVKASGRDVPRVAFVCPFWDPAKVVDELVRDLYEPGLHPELWFRWEGKPLILADPERLDPLEEHGGHEVAVRLEPGRTLGQTFVAKDAFLGAGGCFPTWRAEGSAMTLSLYREGPGEALVTRKRCEGIADNAWVEVRSAEPLPAGAYRLELSEAEGVIGWWSFSEERVPGGSAQADGKACPGDRTLRLRLASEPVARLRERFTFRAPQPDYFRGPTKPDMWSWLEVAPQHVFTNARGEREQMSVGVAQNAVGSRLGSMSEPGARGRSFHAGETDRRPDAVRYGLNFAEQFERALREDPRVIFVTGWNEWIAGRFAEFGGVREPVMFVDQFDQEHSRDIEPMARGHAAGGHGDDYYYQLVALVRRFKGARPPLAASPPRAIRLDAGFSQWAGVLPEWRDDIGDVDHRDHAGYNDCARYTSRTGRNDIVAAKATHDDETLWVHARTREPLTPRTDPRWMVLLLDVDQDWRTGWEGYDLIVNRVPGRGERGVLERNAGGWTWQEVGEVDLAVATSELMVAIPRSLLGAGRERGWPSVDIKWADNIPDAGDILRFITDGDVAPNGRFNFRYEATESGAQR